jgi:ABC-type polysaccharide transport system permease subunit
MLPFVTYKYKSKTYMLRGNAFITGKSICKGTYQLTPNVLIWISLVCLVLLVATILFLSRKKPRLAAILACIFAMIPLAFYLLLGYTLPLSIEAAKAVTRQSGLTVCQILAFITFAATVWELRTLGILSSLHFMLVPGFLYLLINNYIPMIGIFIAFKKVDYSKGIFKSDWVGLKNFKVLFSTQDAWIITRNTLLYNIAFIILGLLTGLIVGLCLYELFSKRLQKIYQTTILIPQLISMIIVAYIVYAFLSNEVGMVNSWLGEGKEINFYAEPKYWPFILTFVHIWKGLGYNAIIFLSSICGIDKNLYDAAKVDGASKWKQLIHVTLPQLKPTVITLFLLSCGRIFYSDFGLFYQVTQHAGALTNITSTIDVYVYKALMVNNNIATSSAAGAFQAIVGFLLVITVNGIVKKVDRDNALF